MAAGAKNPISKTLVWIILLLLIIGLAGFGATNFGGTVRTVGTVGDTEIPVTRYANALQRELRSFEQQTGQRISFSEARQFGLDRAVLAQVVGLAAIEDETDRLGISVGDEIVREEILQIEAFRGLDGGFDREAYEFALDQSGLTVEAFEESIRDETARTILQGAVVGGVTAPEVLTETLYDFARETRDFTWAQLTRADLAEPLPEPSEEDLRTFYEENEDRFTLPERRRITYAYVTPDLIVGDIEVDEEQLRALYEERADQYRQPERRLVERLIFADAEAAQNAAAAIEAGETTFEALVEERGLTLADVDLGDVARDELPDAAAEAVFALDAPGVVGPVETPLGPALFRMNGILAAQETTFEEAREDLQAEYARDTARRRIEDEIEPLDDLLAGGATLEELDEETILETGEILWAPGDDQGIAAYEAFRQAAQEVQEGDFPEILELSDGGLFALRLDEVVEPTLQPFEDVEVQVIEAWEAAETRARLIARAEEIAAAVEGDETLEDQPLALMTETGLARDAFLEDAPVQLVTAAFEGNEGEVQVIETEDGAALLRVDAVAAPDGDTEEAQQIKQRFAAQAGQGYAQDLVDAFTRAVEMRAGIELNQAAINAVHAQFP